jgi:hypothetical protein
LTQNVEDLSLAASELNRQLGQTFTGRSGLDHLNPFVET